MDQRLIISLTAAFSAAAGAFVGFKVAVKKLDAQYNDLMEAEIARTRKFYERVHKAGDFETPASAAEALGVPADEALDAAADAVVAYQGKVDYTKFAPESVGLTLDPENMSMLLDPNRPINGEVIEQNIFEKPDEPEDIGFSPRDPNHPYLITMMEFAENDDEYEQLSATYYAGDQTLTDDQDKPIQHPDPVIGLDNLEKFGTKRVIYVRNERLKSDYEVNLSDGKYAYEVAGFTHGDETYQRMPRRRSADE